MSEGLSKTRAEISHQVSEMTQRFNSRWDGVEGRMDKLGGNFEELKQLLLNLQGSKKGEAATGVGASIIGTPKTRSVPTT